MGPRARDVLAAVTTADVSNAAFPFGHVRIVPIAGTEVRALRVTYVGELGWELHIPLDKTGDVFDALMEAGKPFGMRPVGYRALEALRLEKGYRAWGSDITPNDTPLEAGSRLGSEAQEGHALHRSCCPRGRLEQAAEEGARDLHHRARGHRPARPRNHPPRRPVRRLPHLGRLRLHDRQAHRPRLSAQGRRHHRRVDQNRAATSWWSPARPSLRR